jgi:hypothetical protein
MFMGTERILLAKKTLATWLRQSQEADGPHEYRHRMSVEKSHNPGDFSVTS